MKYNIGVVVYPTEFSSNYIYIVEPIFNEALSEILERSGRKEPIKAMFKQRLRFLEERKHEVFQKRDWFENPKKHKGICFMKIKDNNLNIRISFKMITYKSKQYAILISAFTETKKSTAKTDSHASHITSIQDIIVRLEEVLENGLST